MRKTPFIITPAAIQKTFEGLDRLNALGRSSLVFKEIPTMFFMDFFPGFKGQEEAHEDEDDFMHVIEGSGNLLLDRKKVLKIKKGDFIYIPNKMVHKLSPGKAGIKYIVVKIKKYS